MNFPSTILETPARRLSDEGWGRLLSRRGEPLFIAGWERALFVHFEVDADILQCAVPFPLDLRDGRAFVSLVAFTMRGMRPRIGGRLAAWPFKPIATHHFLNVRTYVRHRGEPGIFFIAEWLSNWLSAQLGPLFYGLPYHLAEINYCHHHLEDHFLGEVRAAAGGFRYAARFSGNEHFAPCAEGSPDEFLLERYTAYTARGAARRFFRIWHPPWPQARMEVSIADDSLLRKNFPWFAEAKLVGANYSPGFDEVWMGRAHRIR
jgi:uncharacterized protein